MYSVTTILINVLLCKRFFLHTNQFILNINQKNTYICKKIHVMKRTCI